MTTKPALLPCPFCEGEASFSTHRTTDRETIRLNNRDSGFGVNCVACGMGTRSFGIGCATQERAAELWNRRALSAPLPVGSDAAMEAWHSALNDAGELFSNAKDEMYRSRASRVVTWIKANRPATHPQAAPPKDFGTELVIAATRCYGDSEWFREFKVGPLLFLAPLDDQEPARHLLARALATPCQEASR